MQRALDSREPISILCAGFLFVGKEHEGKMALSTFTIDDILT
jgi:hypothetical protein